ncbi:Wzz/FepE/Etk N-terminal domain-containing protein [Schleiferiaceae bacterium]|nr:Wzz/FepE/Etk N-terminal domain-containing protein [Schleiferiaceae bacterium]
MFGLLASKVRFNSYIWVLKLVRANPLDNDGPIFRVISSQFLLNCTSKPQENSMDQQLPEQPNFTSPKADDEITLKDIILKIQEWFSIVWPHRIKIIALSLAIGLAAALYTKFTSKPTYTASYQLFFQEESGGLSGAMRLASSFGLGGGAGSASSSATVQEYITSRSNIAKAMTAPLENGRLIDRYYAEALEENEEYSVEFSSKFGANQRYTDSTLTVLFNILNAEFLTSTFDEESGTLDFKVTAENEAFAFDLANNLVQGTQEQFKEWKREKSQTAVIAFQKKVDSLEVSIDQALFLLGQYEDQNNSLVSSVDKMKRMRLTIDFESLKVAYGEYVKGLEMSKAELMNLEAPFKYFDQPTYPLQKDKGSAAKAGVFGSVITGFLLVLFFIGRVEAKNIMAD